MLCTPWVDVPLGGRGILLFSTAASVKLTPEMTRGRPGPRFGALRRHTLELEDDETRRDRTTRTLFLGVALAVGAGAAGCDDDQPIEIPETSAEIGPEGGEVVAGDASIAVPAGALSEPVEITLATAESSLAVEGYSSLGPTLEILPAGTSFEVPATVRLPFDAGELPEGATASQVVIATVTSLGETPTFLETTVDEAASIASAPVEHLSFFVPLVPTPTAPGFPPCGSSDCDCSIRETRPLDVIATTTVGRRIYAICLEAGDELRVTSYTYGDPDEVFDTRLDAESLAVLSEDEVAEPLSSHALCQPAEESFVEGDDGDVSYSVEFVEHWEGDLPEDRWFEALLSVSSDRGSIDYSFNRYLNEAAPLIDGDAFYPRRNTVVGRVHDDGSATFYLHVVRELHIDMIQVDHLASVLADPESHLDEHGQGIPDFRQRFELFDDPAQQNGSSVYHPSLHLATDGLGRDLVTVLDHGVRGFVVDATGTFVERPELVIDDFYGGWQNGGVEDGRLVLQAGFASFSNSMLAEIDPVSWTVAQTWEIGCIGPPTLDGFEVLDSGVVLRLSLAEVAGDMGRVMFFRGGDVLAIGDVWSESSAPRVLVAADQSVVYTMEDMTGEIMAIAVP